MRRIQIKKTKAGVVVSDKMDKTVVVLVERLVSHSVYKKKVRRFSRFKAHDKDNSAHIGDRVEIKETRPLSKEKRWYISRIIERSNS
ncbi:MAG: 30S ribosomal protein S17 [bacterium]|nr:30S ribosomal protein S17 [bacterium]